MSKDLKVAALNDKVIVQVIEPETMTAGGLIIAGSITGSLKKGKIISAGPKVSKDEHGVSVGDVVAFHDGHGEKVEGYDEVRVVPVLELRYLVD